MASEELRIVFYTTLAAIPAGRYSSYGEIAKLCGVHVHRCWPGCVSYPKIATCPGIG